MAEIGDFCRFAHPRELMAWLGLVSREHSFGASTVCGAITKTGSRRARRVLVDGAWTYRLPAGVSRELLRRNWTLPEATILSVAQGDSGRPVGERDSHHIARRLRAKMSAIYPVSG
jgi:transposase